MRERIEKAGEMARLLLRSGAVFLMIAWPSTLVTGHLLDMTSNRLIGLAVMALFVVAIVVAANVTAGLWRKQEEADAADA